MAIEDDDDTHSRFIVKMDDHAAMVGASEDKIMRTTKVITRRPTRKATDGVFNLRAMDLEEGRISDEAREFVLREIDAGRIVIDPTVADRNNSIRAAIFDEFERRLTAHRQKKSKSGKSQITVAERQNEVQSMVNSKDDLNNLDLDDLEDPTFSNQGSSKPKLGVARAANSDSSQVFRKESNDSSLASVLKIPGFSLDVGKQPRVYCQLAPENVGNPTLTFAAHWYYTLGDENPTDMVFVVDNRDTEAYDAMNEMLDYILGDRLEGNRIYYAKVTAEVPGSDQLQNLTVIDLTCQLAAASLEFGIFHLLVIPLEQ